MFEKGKSTKHYQNILTQHTPQVTTIKKKKIEEKKKTVEERKEKVCRERRGRKRKCRGREKKTPDKTTNEWKT